MVKAKIANRIVQVDCFSDCINKSLSDYCIVDTLKEAEIAISISQTDVEVERKKSERYEGNVRIFPTDETIIQSLLLQRLSAALIDFNVLLMHGAVVTDGENAYMFTASSGVGKTTRAEFFLNQIPGSYIINGDKPFLLIDKTKVIAYGSPWCGKEGKNTNNNKPLKAIFILERTENNEESSLIPIDFSEAYISLLQQIYRPENKALMMKTLDMIDQMNGRTQFYRFRSSLDPTSVRSAYYIAKNK